MTEATTVLQTAEETVGTQLLRALLDEVMNLRTPWAITPQSMQQEVIDRLQTQVENITRGAVLQIATLGMQHVGASVESLTIKEGAKAVLTLARGSEEMHALADRVGSFAVLVFADPKEFTEGMHVIKAQADQRDLLDDAA